VKKRRPKYKIKRRDLRRLQEAGRLLNKLLKSPAREKMLVLIKKKYPETVIA